MSQSSIGKAALVLVTDAGRAKAGLAQFGKDTRAWATDLGRFTSKATGGEVFGGMIRSAPQAILAAGAVAVSFGTVRSAVETLQDLTRQDAAAKAFGLTAEQFTGIAGLAKSAGEDTREFVESLVTLGKVASEGAAGKGEVATQWFKDLNLNAAEFASLRLDEKFFQVFDALSRISDPGQRVRALMVAFGEDGGKYLLPLLSKAPAELRQLAASFAVSNAEMEKARLAGEAFARAQVQIQQLWRRIVVAAAPVLEFLVAELGHTIDQFSRMEDTAVPALSKILRLTAQLADATKAVTAATLIAIGARLKFVQAEVIARSTLYGASKGGAKGAAIGLAAGVGLAAGIEAAIGPEIREAGGVFLDLGRKMIEDVGGSTKRVEAFIEMLAKRKPGEAIAALGGNPPQAQAPLKLKPTQTDNPALIQGSAAEVSARAKYEFGQKTAQEKMLEQQRQANKLLKDVVAGIHDLADRFGGVGALLPF